MAPTATSTLSSLLSPTRPVPPPSSLSASLSSQVILLREPEALYSLLRSFPRYVLLPHRLMPYPAAVSLPPSVSLTLLPFSQVIKAKFLKSTAKPFPHSELSPTETLTAWRNKRCPPLSLLSSHCLCLSLFLFLAPPSPLPPAAACLVRTVNLAPVGFLSETPQWQCWRSMASLSLSATATS
jgi:hypothetical protein